MSKTQAQQRKKTYINKRISEANIQKSVITLLTGNGKGKTSSAIGMIIRALGWGQNVVLVQFLKGKITAGEDLFLSKQKNLLIIKTPGGFTWDTQNKKIDTKNALATWDKAKVFLHDENINLIVFDELTYMLNYQYLDNDILVKIKNRTKNQNIVITGRAANKDLVSIADTVSEIKNTKHAFNNNIKAQKGVDL